MSITALARLTGKSALEEAARRYATLKAWGRDLTECDATIRAAGAPRNRITVGSDGVRESSRPEMSTGHAWGGDGKGRYVVTAGTDIADAHATILHELAHLAAPRNAKHGLQWRLIFRAAIGEVIGRDVVLGYSGETPGSNLTTHEFHSRLKNELGLFLYRDVQL